MKRKAFCGVVGIRIDLAKVFCIHLTNEVNIVNVPHGFRVDYDFKTEAGADAI